MIDKFLEVRPGICTVGHPVLTPLPRGYSDNPRPLNAARENADSFNELAKEVEVFSRKVVSALRVQVQPADIFEMIWNGTKQYVFVFQYDDLPFILVSCVDACRLCVEIWRVSQFCGL